MSTVIPDRAYEALKACGRKTVRAVAQMSGPAADQLFELAAGDRREWNAFDWQAVLDSLDSCNDRVCDWLALRV